MHIIYVLLTSDVDITGMSYPLFRSVSTLSTTIKGENAPLKKKKEIGIDFSHIPLFWTSSQSLTPPQRNRHLLMRSRQLHLQLPQLRARRASRRVRRSPQRMERRQTKERRRKREEMGLRRKSEFHQRARLQLWQRYFTLIALLSAYIILTSAGWPQTALLMVAVLHCQKMWPVTATFIPT